MIKSCSLLLPYCKVNGNITESEMAFLYDIYSGRFSKLWSFTNYLYQSAVFNGETSSLFEEIEKVKLCHVKNLASAITIFGGNPVFSGPYNFFSTKYTCYLTDLKDVILYDIDAEKEISSKIREFADYCNNISLCELLSRIALDDELHQRILIEKYEELF